MHVLILEASLTGHHTTYLNRIADTFLASGHTITVGIPRSEIESPAALQLSTKGAGRLTVVPLHDSGLARVLSGGGLVGREMSLWLRFKQTFREVMRLEEVHAVFLPYADFCLYAIGLLGSPFGSTEWSGICMRPSFHLSRFGVRAPVPKYSQAKEKLFLRALRNSRLSRMFSIDPLLVRYAAAQENVSSKVVYLADPGKEPSKAGREVSRTKLSIPQDASVILVYGAIDERKGISDLLNALASDLVPESVHVAIAGRQFLDADVKQRISDLAAKGRAHVWAEVIDDETEGLLFAASDAVWLGYKNHYTMSGVLVLAGLAGLPVVSSDSGLLAYWVNEFGLGQAINTEDADLVAGVIKNLLNANSGRVGRDGPQVFAAHTEENFRKVLGCQAFDAQVACI